MAVNFEAAFKLLKPILGEHSKKLSLKADTPIEYTLVGKRASPFPQHKGRGMYFGSVRLGKAYVSFHLMPLYMNPALSKTISPSLKKRMQGKTCFNFKSDPDPKILSELRRLTQAGLKLFKDKKWV